MRLSTAVVGVTPAVRYTGSSEIGSTATIVGYGKTGTGLTGDTLAYGTKRAGRNILDVLGSGAGHPTYIVPDDYLVADFDRPNNVAESSLGSPTPLDLEYSSAHGDSGGAMFIGTGAQTRLAGVISFGLNGPTSNPDAWPPNADYGDLMGFTRVSLFNGWIDDQISAIYWSNSAGGSFGTAANWADGLAPGAANIAVFKTAGTYTATLTADTSNKRLRVRTGNVTLNLGGHTYTLANTLTDRSILVGQVSGDNASLTLTGGTVTVVDASLGEASGATGSLRLTGTGTSLVLSGSLGVGGSPTAAGGTGSFIVENSTSAQIGGNVKIWTGGTVNVEGSLTTSGFDLTGGSITGSGQITANGTSTWSNGTISGSGTTTIGVGGTLTVSQNSSKTTYWRFNNTGTVQVQAGTLSLANSGSSTGAFAISSGATLNFASDYYSGIYNLNAGSSITGSGTLAISNGTLNYNTGASIAGLSGPVNLSGGILSGTGNLTLTTLNWTGGSMSGSGSTTIAAGGTLTMSGSSTKTVTGRALVVNGSMVQTGSGGLSSTGPLTVSGAAAVFDLGASHSATAATLTVDGGGSITGTGTSGVTATASFEMKSGAAGAILQGTGIPLNKTTAGTVTLSGANTYTGVTTVGGGVLRLNSTSALPGGIGNTGGTSRLTFGGGVLGLGSGDFSRGLGSGATQAGFTGSGGFAAYTANRTVNLGGAGAGVAWDTGSFVPAGAALILGAATADATVTFQNPIALGGAVRTVQVDDGSAATDAKLTGALTSSVVGGLIKTGAGTLNLDSATQSYNALTASAGTTNVNGVLGTLPGLAVVTVGSGARLKFGTVSQKLASLSIGAGATVTFTSGPASFADSGDGKAPALTGDPTGNTAVPEPGALALLLTGALGVLHRRRRGGQG